MPRRLELIPFPGGEPDDRHPEPPARRRHEPRRAPPARPLTLLSVLADYEIPIPHYSAATHDDRDWTVLRRFASDIARDRPHLRVSHEMVSGGTVRALLARSADEDLLVVGQRGLGTFSRALVGSTSIAVAGRSRVPVVIVPDGWSPTGHANEPVVVGLDPDDVHAEAVTYATLEARRRGVSLLVVHGWEARVSLVRARARRHASALGRAATGRVAPSARP